MCGDQCNGILMKSLFQGWPRERLSQIYFPTVETWQPDHSLCADYRSISSWGRVRLLKRSSSQERITPKPPPTRLEEFSGSIRRKVTSLVRQPQWMNWLRPCAELWNATFPLSRLLECQLRELQPDCVYALLGNYHLTKNTYLACSRLNLPLYTHVTDDFVTAQYQDVPFSGKLQSLSDKWFRRAVDYSQGLAAISPLMAQEYSSRYGKEWSWFTTGIDPDVYDPLPRRPDGILRLVYSGNLGLERWRTLRTLALALQSLNSDELPIRLAIYGPENQLREHGTALNISPVVELRGWAQPDKLPQIFHDSDILVHVESCDTKKGDYTRLSFSTKLSQYMMANRGILMVGSAEAGSLRMVSRVGAGFTTNEVDPLALAKAIASLLRDRARQESYGTQGRNWALQWCDQSTAHERFRREIQAVVDSRKGEKWFSRAAG